MTPTIYFAGINTIHFCECFKGYPVLESFACNPAHLARFRPTFSSIILDCGAFSALTSGKKIDLCEYADFCLAHGKAYAWMASLDAIDGGADANVANWAELKRRGVDCVPTFHQGEPWSLLSDYCATSPRIGLGFQRPIRNAREWLEECFARIPTGHKVHGWAMTSYTDFPFESVDSTTWLFEMQALMGVKGQGGAALACLTQGELIEIVVKKYLRLPKRLAWGAVKADENQGDLFGGAMNSAEAPTPGRSA